MTRPRRLLEPLIRPIFAILRNRSGFDRDDIHIGEPKLGDRTFLLAFLGGGVGMTNHSGVGIELHDHLSRASCDTQTTDFAISLREEIAPRGLLESLIFEQILTAVEEARSNDGTLDSTTVRKAERKLASGLRSLLDLRLIRANTATRPGFERDIDGNRGHWQDRLSWESSISEASPTIRGTWITVDQVVSRIVDGWSWIDILRAHPELSENDIRACLSYSVEENSMG